MNLLYFVPEANTMGQATAVLKESPAAGILETKPSFVGAQGPANTGSGTLVALPDASGQVPRGFTYKDATQTWRPVQGGKVWVGFDRNARPTPADLLRGTIVEGHNVMLGDRQRWLVPAARRWRKEDGEPRWVHALPTKRTIDAEGNWSTGPVAERFSGLWNRLDSLVKAQAAFAGGDESALDWFDLDAECALITDALAVNYRVGPPEVALLGLIESGTLAAVLDALCDAPTLKELRGKEQAPGEDSISPGAEAS
jgi:hypothetical protein